MKSDNSRRISAGIDPALLTGAEGVVASKLNLGRYTLLGGDKR